jgi:hypothetical protein
MDVGAIDVHHEFLVAAMATARGLEDQSLPVVAEVRLGVFRPKGELANSAEVLFAGFGRGTGGGGVTRACRNRRRDCHRGGGGFQ